jgi:hypothetical protein
MDGGNSGSHALSRRRSGTWHWSSAGSPGVSVLALSGPPSSAATSPTPARTCRGWPTCPPRARSRCSASSTAPTTTGGTLSIPPRHPPSVSVLGCPYRFLARPFRFASAPAGGLKCDCRSLDGFGFGCPARSAARCATPRSPRTPSAGTSRSEWRLPPNPPHRTACRAVGGLRSGLLGVRFRRAGTAPDAVDAHCGRETTPAGAGAPQSPPGHLGQEAQRWPLLQPAAPHHQPDRRNPVGTSRPRPG